MNAIEDFHPIQNRFPFLLLGEVLSIETDDDTAKRTGRAKIRVHPIWSDVDEDDLPWSLPAYSIGNNQHSTPQEGDTVAGFFVNGWPETFIYAFKLTHLIDNSDPSTPEVAWKKPDWYDDLDNNTVSETVLEQDIKEPGFTYEDNFPNKKAFEYGKWIIEIDTTEDSEQIILHLKDSNYYFRIDSNKDLSIKFVNFFLNLEEKFLLTLTDLILKADNFYFDIGGNKFKITSNTGIEIEDKNGNKWKSTSSGIEEEDLFGNKIKTDATSIILNDNLKVLK